MAARKSYARRAPAADEGGELADEKRVTVGGIVAIAADTILNAGGMWAVVLGLDRTDSYAMFALSFSGGAHKASAAGDMRFLPALAIALGLGYLLCIAPHKLWKRSGFGDAQQTRRRLASLVAAAGGWYTTWRFVEVVAVGGWVGLGISLALEWLLFEFKREVLR
jgi:hypothetical protein